jgi:type IV pilus assembly protein PilA
MPYRNCREHAGEGGFTLIEILVVILIVGILAAVAIPAFLSQTVKADDSAAKIQVGTLETAMQAYASENSRHSFAGATLEALKEVEPTLKDTSTAIAQEVKNVSTTGYEVESVAKGTGDKYTLKYENGSVERKCENEGSSKVCKNGTW